MQLIACLNFDGRAREAMDFYAKALGGTVTGRFTYGESPMAGEMPAGSYGKIMHSCLEVDGAMVVMGADGPPPHDAGSTTVNIMTDTPEEAERIFHALAEDGTVHMPIAETFWAHRFGALQDRYGKGWMVRPEFCFM